MTVILAILGLLGGLGLLGVSAGLGGSAIRRTRERERALDHEGAPTSPPAPGAEPGHRPPQFLAAPSPARSAWPSPGGAPASPYDGAWGGPRRPASPRRMWIGAAASGALGFAALATAAVVLLSLLMAPSRELSVPAQAGGMRRDDSPETRSMLPQQRRRLERDGLPHPLAAVYRGSTGGTPAILFLGASGRLGSPEETLRSLLNVSRRSGGTAPVRHPAGRLGGTVLCHPDTVFVQAAVTSCGWADESTVGVIYSPTAGDSAADLARLLLAMRNDMENRRR